MFSAHLKRFDVRRRRWRIGPATSHTTRLLKKTLFRNIHYLC